MAKFTGTGTLTVNGDESRIYDMELLNSGGLTFIGRHIRGCRINGPIGIANASEIFLEDNYLDGQVSLTNNVDQFLAVGNYFGASAAVGLYVSGSSHTEFTVTGNVFESDIPIHFDSATVSGLVIVGNTLRPTTLGIHFDTGGSAEGIVSANTIGAPTVAIQVDNQSSLIISDNHIDEPDETGIVVNANEVVVSGNRIINPGQGTANTYDGIAVNGNRNRIWGNAISPGSQARYGINVVGGECNMVVGNDLGDTDDYDTDALNDAGANTQLFWPADATYGDNFVDCGTGS